MILKILQNRGEGRGPFTPILFGKCGKGQSHFLRGLQWLTKIADENE
jgi:hypothetical protein